MYFSISFSPNRNSIPMKKFILLFSVVLLGTSLLYTCAQDGTKKKSDIKLLIRGDDIGSFHAANIGCIDSYQNGIMRTVEVMVPCAWYPEAVKMLKENPGLDVGIHLVLTSEWEGVKWRPLTGISSITDEKGYFFPMVWPNDNFPANRAFRESDWTMADVERELRAQIELAKSEIQNVSHISSHMAFTSADESLDSLVVALSKEYGLYINPGESEVKRFKYNTAKESSLEERISAFNDALKALEPGTYMFVEHPALDTREMEAVGHIGYYNVGVNRQMVTDIFTSEEIMKTIESLGIELISYADL